MQHLVALRLAEWALEAADLSHAALLRMLEAHGISVEDGVVLGAMLLRVTNDRSNKYEMLALAFGGTLVYGWQSASLEVQVGSTVFACIFHGS
jgi:hypothetical protein